MEINANRHANSREGKANKCSSKFEGSTTNCKSAGNENAIKYALEYRDFCFTYSNSEYMSCTDATGYSNCAGAAGDTQNEPQNNTQNGPQNNSQNEPQNDTQIGPVNMQIPHGAFALLTGKTGSGKTTLLRCAKPEIAPAGEQTGNIFVNGAAIDNLASRISSAQIAYVAQDPESALVCSTVKHEVAFGLENLGVPAHEIRKRVAEVAYFFGIESWFHKDINELSGGQAQIVNLASAVIAQPNILLLDEPTNQLDPVAQRNFCHILFRLNRELGMTVLVATHTPEIFTNYANKCFELLDGRISEVDTNFSTNTPLLGSVWDKCLKNKSAKPKKATGKISKTSKTDAIQLKNASFRYEKSQSLVLSNVGLRISQGEIHALVSGNGCGKSTLLSLIAGILKPQRGKCKNFLQANQAFLPQNPKVLFTCDSAEEELREWTCNSDNNLRKWAHDSRNNPRERTGDFYTNKPHTNEPRNNKPYNNNSSDADSHNNVNNEIDKVLEKCGLASHKHTHPYDLSSGQQQLLALNKLLLTKPDLLLLDEPTKGLDAESRAKITVALLEFTQAGGTIVLATHDMKFCEAIADNISMLFDTEIVCTFPTDEFFQNNLFFKFH